jgi:hypothetical protein
VLCFDTHIRLKREHPHFRDCTTGRTQAHTFRDSRFDRSRRRHAWLAKKIRLSGAESSAALPADAAQSALCACLSLIALVGLAINAIWQVKWADPIVALAIIPLVVWEVEKPWAAGLRLLLGSSKLDAKECRMPNPRGNLKERLARYRQIKISVIGRKSGHTISIPVWFVLEGEKLFLLPVQGSDTQWYKNVLSNPKVRIDARVVGAEFRAMPITGAKAVNSVVEKFREKYGARDVKKYYSKFDVAVRVELD